MCAFGCHDNHIFYPIYPKTKCNRSTTPWMLHIKFDQSWQTGLRDIHVWKYKYVYGIFSALKGTYLQSDWSDPTGILNRYRFTFHTDSQPSVYCIYLSLLTFSAMLVRSRSNRTKSGQKTRPYYRTWFVISYLVFLGHLDTLRSRWEYPILGKL